MKSLIIGMGEVGKGLFEVLKKEHEVFMKDMEPLELDGVEVLDICIPYSDKFITIVNQYVEKYKPKLTINHSTVPVGTTRKITGKAVHSPIRGKHPKMAEGIMIYQKYIGYNDEETRRLAEKYLGAVVSVRSVEKSETSELAKLLSLGRYGVNIAFAQEQKAMCDKWGLDYEDVVFEYEKSYNNGLDKVGIPDLKRPLLDPPEGRIGGHCVRENSIVLNEQYPSNFLKEVIMCGAPKAEIGEGTKIWDYTNVYPTAKVGKNCVIGSYSEIGDGVIIGNNCKIGAYVFIPKGVTIGNNVFIGPKSCFTNDKYPKAVGEWEVRETRVLDGASIGANVTVVCGVTIGKNSMIGAGSVVTRDIGERVVVMGNPARERSK